MSFAYMPLFTGDYLRDTRHLTPLRHGIYLLALIYCWDSKGPMPLDEQESAGICNCRSADEVEALRYVLERYFVRMDDGHYNKRMARVVAHSELISKARSAGGLRSAQSRRNKAVAGAAEKRKPKGSEVAEHELNLSSTQVELQLVSPSPIKKRPLLDESSEVAFNLFWVSYPKKRARAVAAKAFARIKPGAEKLQTMMDALESQKRSNDWLKEKGKYIPYPASWLNAERWTDESSSASWGSTEVAL